MNVALYMDVHIPRAVTEGLRARGVDVLTAQEDGAATLPDPELLDRSTKLGRVLFTHDKGFLAETARRQARGPTFAGLVFANEKRLPVGHMIADLEIVAQSS